MDDQTQPTPPELPPWAVPVELVYLPDLQKQEAKRRRQTQKAAKTNDLSPSEDRIPPKTQPAADPKEARHTRKCQICHHPDRFEIDEEYRLWRSPYEIAREYNVPPRALFRHFHAQGLVSKRRENLRFALDKIIERGAERPLTGDMIIRAVRAHCLLTDDNRWVEPVKRVEITRVEVPGPPGRAAEFLIDTLRLENHASH
jgi:hypothetical protein